MPFTVLPKMDKKILVLDRKDSRWIPLLREFFDESPSAPHFFHDSSLAGAFLQKETPDLVFARPELLSLALSQKLKVLRQSVPEVRLFQLEGSGPATHAASLAFDASFREPATLSEFQKQLVQHLVYPEVIKVLVVDDEQEIGTMIRDFLEQRVSPAFEVQWTEDGRKGLELIEKSRHDVVILDVKMPRMDGRDIYREIVKRKYKIPVIIFFDAISGDEIVQIHEIGRPTIVEKGFRSSSMPDMMSLIKKKVYFG